VGQGNLAGIIAAAAANPETFKMRMMLMTAAAVAVLAGTQTSQAQYLPWYDGPWCMVESMGRAGEIRRCDMRSFEMCRAEMGARGGTSCVQNSYWPGWYAAAQPAPRKRKAKRHYR
jgi:hypothetical protein